MLLLRILQCLLLLLPSERIVAEALSLDPKAYYHLEFANKQPNRYAFVVDTLEISVDQSASAMILAFDQIKPVGRVSFQWRADGRTQVRDRQHEQSKQGDDFVLRVGLILSGKAPFIPFFAPAWIKSIRQQMKLPGNKMLYLVTDARTPVGESWLSSFNDSISYLAVTSSAVKDGWQQVDQRIESKDVVGMWLMADGDDTQSRFATRLRHLEINK